MTGLQNVVARAMLDPAFVDRVCAEPVDVAREYAVEPDDVRALAGQATGMRLAARASVKKALYQVETLFPVTYRLLNSTVEGREHLVAHLHCTTDNDGRRWWGEHRARRLLSYVERHVDRLEHPFLADVLRAEIVRHEVFNDGTVPRSEPDCPVLAPAVRIAGFDYRVGTIRQRVLDGGSVGETAPEPSWYAFVRDSTEDVRMYRIPAPLAELLLRCDGHTTVDALTAEFGTVTAALEQARAREILR